jgi:hypothetical protein
MGGTSCSGISSTEVDHVQAWQLFTQSNAYPKRINLPASVMLVAMHNMVSETVDSEYIPPERKNFYCPQTVVADLKKGILSQDKEVAGFTLASYDRVDGIPGLATSHDSVNCP